MPRLEAMRIDIVTIFPAFFDVLDVSLIGKARDRGILDMHVHDLRDWTHDRHRTVDDTPYGGGAGMVMKPEPWGEALDELLTRRRRAARAVAGGRAVLAARWRASSPRRSHLVFACGRYEGIDQRVVDHYAARGRVRLVSLGDYVLNGGEVAAMAVVEAVSRLVPGVVGNPESLVEESHEDGLLEYPSYTKPAGLARPRGAAGAAERQPRRDRRVAAGAEPGAHPAAPPRSAAADLRPSPRQDARVGGVDHVRAGSRA